MTDPIVPVFINFDTCTHCQKCLDSCPTGVFQLEPNSERVTVRYRDDCHVCFLCVPDCPVNAITVSWDTPNRRHHSIYDLLSIDVATAPSPHRGREE